MRLLRRDFLPPELRRVASQAGVQGAVSVQARQTIRETRFLLDLARNDAFLRAVVGWVPLVEPGVAGILEELADEPKFKACRHVLQDEADDDFMLRADFNAGIRAVTEAGLVYDVLIFERHLPQTLEFVDRHPDQVFVLDHIAKPRIREESFATWRDRIRELARRPRIYCKISGMATEAAWGDWSEADLRPYLDVVLDAFGPSRLMFGSDWPVCLVATSYQRWARIVTGFAAGLGETERDRILGGTATEAYGLDVEGSLQ